MASNVKSGFKKRNASDSRKKDVVSLYPLRMTEDHKTEMYVKFAKVMVIFQGPVTEERHEAVKELASKFKYAGRIVSDETFKRETASVFLESKVEDFYQYFKSRVKKSCEDGYNLIVIDPSMTNVWVMKYFCFLAQKMQYVVLPYPPLPTDGSYDVVKTQAVHFKENTGQRVDRPNYFNYLFCGWFLHDIDSAELREEASLYVQDCFDGITDFQEMFSSICGSTDFRSYFNMIDKRQDLAFCTVKIFQHLLDTKEYMSSPEFLKFYGSMSKMYVVGFIISPHMIAARVRLTNEQRKLWEMPDDLEESFEPTSYPTELLQSTKVNISGEEVTLISSKSNRTLITGDSVCEPTEVIKPRDRARSCHFLLGRASNAPVKNVNYDVPFAVCRERIVTQKYSEDLRPYDLDKCVVKRIGKYWFVYLKQTLIVNALFASCCSVETN